MRDLDAPHLAAGQTTGNTESTGDQPLIACQSLSFRSGTTALLQDVSLEFQPGRCSVIMGHNGAGKTLLLRLLHGLVPLQSGHILWQGKPVTKTARQAQAMVFQTPVMLRRSVLGNIRFALAAKGVRGLAQRQQAEQALEEAGLSDLADRPARVLSGGERQRLAVARALACKPELLFLDEPTISLDPASTAAIESLITQAIARGTTAILVTHDRRQARRLGHDMVFLHKGQVAETGPVAQLLDTPKSRVVQLWSEGHLLMPEDKE